jgi:hypothetical protein
MRKALSILPTDTCQNDPDLAAVVAAWPDLPEAIRATIVTLVRVSSSGTAYAPESR